VSEPLEKLEALYEGWSRGDFSGHVELFHPEMKAGLGVRSKPRTG
jgi:hypothetical protein